MGTACGIAAITYRLDLLVALRMIQGFSGGTLLVAGQSIIFLAYPRSCQPILQALFAMGSVVAPATIAPALQGWLIDSQSWAWIFFGVVPVALAAIGLLLIADGPRPVTTARPPFVAAMWMLSGSTSESGADDMMQPSCCAISTSAPPPDHSLIASGRKLGDRNRASGIGLFNTGRQLSGLMEVAGLQTP